MQQRPSEAIFLADQVVVMTPRPGRIASIVDVTLPRTLHMQVEPEFNRLVEEVRTALGAF